MQMSECFENYYREKKGAGLKNHLAKIGASAEHGSEQGAALSRTTKLVMAATDKTPKYKGQSSPSSRPPSAKRQRTLTVSHVQEHYQATDCLYTV